jgi:chitinase
MNHYYHISCDQSIKTLAFLGVPPQKIILGYPSYALAYGSVENQNNGLFQKSDPNKMPNFDNALKTHDSAQYITVLKLLKQGFQPHATYSNNHISGTWAYNPDTKQFLAYDTPELIKEKSEYAAKNHLGGLMTWNINDDAPVTSRYSLLKATR